MKFSTFSAANTARCVNGFGHKISDWSLSDWFVATMGELGEAANIAKKLNRFRDGIKGNTKTEEHLRMDLADEIADTFVYLDLLATSAGLVLEDIVIEKWNRTSFRIGYDGRLEK